MHSMNYLGRLVSNFKEFYNEINAATLTGAIDVVVVEQADGTFTCSPFHVRFGKLGVLRSREKIVDIEINGEPQNIHMKLGDSGEAFFVEEVASSESEQIPEHLATSPIPVSEFDKLYTGEDKPRRKSIDLVFNDQLVLENQVSDFSQRRYTDSQDEDFSLKKKEFLARQIELGNIELGENSVENVSKTDSVSANNQSHEDFNQDPELSETIFKMDSLDIEQEPPKETLSKTELPKLELLRTEEPEKSEMETKTGKKKRRKKSVMKKKNSQRKTSNVSMNDINSLESQETVDSKINESVTDKSSLGSSNSEQELVTDPTVSRLPGRDTDFLFFSDTELTANSGHNSRPSTPIQSDTEFEVSQRKESDEQMTGQSWAWGQLPNAPNNMDLNNITDQTCPDAEDIDVDCESGNGPSLPQSPNSVEAEKSLDSDYEDHPKSDSVKKCLQDISLSLCGWNEHPNEDSFIRHVVSFTDLCNNPSLLESPELVVRIADKYYSWKVATPILISMLVYQRQLPQSTIEQLCSLHMPNNNIQTQTSQKPEVRGYSWWSWRRRGVDSSVDTQHTPTDIKQIAPPDVLNKEEIPKSEELPSSSKDLKDDISVVDALPVETLPDETLPTEALPAEIPEDVEQMSSDEGELLKRNAATEMNQSMYGEKFRKTLRLSSEQIAKLNLKEGMNEVEFSVTTAYQGTTRCKCHIYRWRYDDKIVISDIDGTITKSDVLGHILPIVGKDWAQSGVAQLFTKIKNNGYKLLYLSARAIGQARVTREYLRSIKQGDLSLPDGPLLLNPTSLISAFHREVIEKKPEQFKISCLSDIQALFPTDSNPFYAGYGNRINDVWAYRAVGIPIVRIFTINHKGELKHELTKTFQSSYTGQSGIVNDLFPPLHQPRSDIEIKFF